MAETKWTGKTLGVLGGGNMAEALLRGVICSGLLPASSVTVFDILPERRAVFAELGCSTADQADGIFAADAILLATKPQHVDEALRDVRFRPEQLLISILAGVATTRLEAKLPGSPRVIRVMPNTPLLVGKGMSALAGGAFASQDDIQAALELFSAGGDAVEVSETDLDAVTALSGSGPAYLFFFMEALLKSGEALGLESGLARRLALGTLDGAVAMLTAGGDETDLRRRVTSPGGTTAAAIAVLEENHFAETITQALKAACDRSAELGRGNG